MDRRNKYILVFLILIIAGNIIYYGEKLIRYDGKILYNIGTYKHITYAYGKDKNSGIYKKANDDGKYNLISRMEPLNNEQFYFKQNKAIYTAASKDIVVLDLVSFEDDVYTYSSPLEVMGINDTMIIAVSSKGEDSTVIIDSQTMAIRKTFDMRLQEIRPDRNTIELVDMKSKKKYLFHLVENRLEEIGK